VFAIGGVEHRVVHVKGNTVFGFVRWPNALPCRLESFLARAVEGERSAGQDVHESLPDDRRGGWR